MPGRIGNSPGPQVITSERPVPAARRSSLLSNKSPVAQHQHQTSGVEATSGYPRPQVNQLSMAPNGTDGQTYVDSRRQNAGGHSLQPQLPYGQPHKPVSTVRPQSVMGSTISMSYEHVPNERPPPLQGADMGLNNRFERGSVYSLTDGRKTPVNANSLITLDTVKSNKIYSEHDHVVIPLHERTRSFGDGVSIAEPGFSGSDGVYGSVARQPQHYAYDSFDRRAQSMRDIQANGTIQASLKNQPNGFINSPKSSRGQENLAFVPDDKMSATKSFVPGAAAGGHDLRNAWQRLYGGRTETPSHSQNPSLDGGVSRKIPTMEEAARYQNGFVPTGHHASPQSIRHPAVSIGTPGRASNSTPSSIRRPSSGSVTSRPAISPLDTTSPNDYPYGSPLSMNPHPFVPDRDSPTGQSSSNPEQISGSNNSSQLSSMSNSSGRHFSTFKPEQDKPGKVSESAIGPAARYPDMPMLSSSLRSPRLPSTPTMGRMNSGLGSSSPQAAGVTAMRHRSLSSQSADTIEFKVDDGAARPMFRPRRKSSVFLDSEDDLDDEEYILAASDYAGSEKEPDAPHLHAVPSTHGSGRSTPANTTSSRFISGSPALNEGKKTPDLLRQGQNSAGPPAGALSARFENNKVHSQPVNQTVRLNDHGGPQIGKHLLTEYTRSRSLEDVRESGNESTISFDIENTVLTVEPSDQSEMGTLRSYKTGSSVRAQLNRLEDMYSRVMKNIEETRAQGPRTRRRWSIGSSDTSSLRQTAHHGRHSRSSNQKIGSKDVKVINRRFQRLESHVITLARSVAHLSSELRNQNTMNREIENVKREITELKLERQTGTGGNPATRGNRGAHDHEKYRYWSPFFANPKRVGKLTRFFGQEPPLLELFLKKLGYEKYLKNFDSEQISMIELPYMTDDRLEKIGIPMGPRLRILQEAQICVKKGDFDIYFV